MPERLFLTFDNRYDTPPEYAMTWLTDFRPDDMKAATGDRAPEIRVTRLPDGRIRREFSMMGAALTTHTTIEGKARWVAVVEAKDKKGRLMSLARVVETVRPEGGGTAHHVELLQDDRTLMSRVMMTLTKPMQRAQIRKLFTVNKRAMEEAYKAGKPATA